MKYFTRSHLDRLQNAGLRLHTLGIVMYLFLMPAASAQQLRIAAAADLQFAMKDLAARFHTQTRLQLTISYGSSGNFFTQIENGAPFDLFFSADIGYPQRLIAAHLADPQTLYSYASGRLILWAPADTHLQLAEKGFSALLDSKVQKIAIANPTHAPYGQAAVAALQKAGIFNQVKEKLVFGENISQAAQFVESGNAQIGIVALSLATSPTMRNGERWLIPAEFHLPLEQAAVVISSSKNKKTAASFLDFIKSPEGREILEKYGFTMTQSSSGESQP